MNYKFKVNCIFHQSEVVVTLTKKALNKAVTKNDGVCIFCLSYINMITSMAKLPEKTSNLLSRLSASHNSATKKHLSEKATTQVKVPS